MTLFLSWRSPNASSFVASGQHEKKSSIGKKCLVNPTTYHAGRPLTTKINAWVRDKHSSLSKEKVEVLLLDEKVSEKTRANELSCFSKALGSAKAGQYIYFLLDASSAVSADDILNFWDDELAKNLPWSRFLIHVKATNAPSLFTAPQLSDITYRLGALRWITVDPTQTASFNELFQYKPGSALPMWLALKQRKVRPPLLMARSSRWMRAGPAWVDLYAGDLFAHKTFDQIGIGLDDPQPTAPASSGKTTFAALLDKTYKARPETFDRKDVEYLNFFEQNLIDFKATELPPAFMTTVKVLVLSYNLLEGNLDLMGSNASPTQFSFNSLFELFASYNKLTGIAPKSLENLKNIRTIDLRHNAITALPVELFTLKTLERLDLSENKIEVIPPEIGQLNNLQVLYVSNNQIEMLPQELGNLSKLREIDASYNQLRKLPLTLSFLIKLREINVDENPLREPPKHIVKGGAEAILSYLGELMKGGEPCLRMKLMFVGQENVGKTSLLRALQSETRALRSAERKDDPLGSPSTQLSGKPVSTDGIDIHTLSIEVDFSDEDGIGQASAPAQSASRLAIPFLGSRNTKSTSTRSSSSSSSNTSNASLAVPAATAVDSVTSNASDSLAAIKWLPKSQKQDLQFSCWDFGGQEVYYTTHSFFLTERSLFLVVFDLTVGADNCRVEYWLNSIKARAPKAPIILVGTHLDDSKAGGLEKANAEMERLLAKYKKPFRIRHAVAVATGVENKQNIDMLLQKMIELARAEPLLRVMLEERCMVEKTKRNRAGQPPVLSWDDLHEMAVNCSIIPRVCATQEQKDLAERDLDRAVDTIHLLGSITRFKDAGLERVIVLDPQFLTKIFATVITTKPNYVKGGVVLVRDLNDQVWKSFPAYIKPLLLALLESFEIVYELEDQDVSALKIEGPHFDRHRHTAQSRLDLLLRTRVQSPGLASEVDNRRVLAPALLPEDKPAMDLVWPAFEPSNRQFSRRYDFSFMPNGLFSRLMIRLLKFGRALVYWRYGCVIASKANEGDKAFVELDRKVNRLTLAVRGAQPAEFFRVIIDLFDSLLVNWFKITYADKIDVAPEMHLLNSLLQSFYECMSLSAKGSWFAVCTREPEDNHIVSMDQVAPDIAMADFEGRRVDVDKEVELQDILGQGAFGKVFRAKFNQEIVAVKQLLTAGKEDEEKLRIFEEFRREVWVMSGLHHPCIVNLKGYSLGENLAMIMELVSGGELYKFLHKPENHVSWALRLRIAWDIAKGMAYLHSASPPLLHRDLKSPNVLLASHSPDAFVVAKVADFGLTGRAFTEFKAVTASERDVENPTWLAPEVMRNEKYSTPSDVYSFGIILWEMVARSHPYDEFHYQWQTDLEAAIKTGKRPTIPDDCPKEYADLIQLCWAHDPKNRPTFKQIVEKLVPPLIDKLAPEVKPFIAKIEQYERELTAVAPASSPRPDSSDSPASSPDSGGLKLKGNHFASLELPTQKIKRVATLSKELWCCTDEGGLVVFNTDSGKLVFNLPGIISAAPVDIMSDAESDSIFVATRQSIVWFPAVEKSQSILGNLDSVFTVTDSSKPKMKAASMQCHVLDETGTLFLQAVREPSSKRSSSAALAEMLPVSEIVVLHTQPAKGGQATLSLKVLSDAREITMTGPSDQIDIWTKALREAEIARDENILKPSL